MNTVRRVFDASRAGQKIVANIYSPTTSTNTATSKRVTLLLAHANGFHKELWEPTLARLFANMDDRPWIVDQAIALDGYNHGDSARMNRDSISDEHESPWFLNARDILAVIKQLNGGNAVGSQSVVGIGHSWGAASLLLAEIIEPSTFSALIATDPVLFTRPIRNDRLREMTMKRRCEWPDHRAARDYFVPHAFFGQWDRRILDLHMQYGLEEEPTVIGGGGGGGDEKKLVLKCRPQNEAAVFAGAFHASPFAADNLWKIQCPVTFLTGETSLLCPPGHIESITKGVRDCQHIVMSGVGHLLVHEDPDRTADHYLKILDSFAPKIKTLAANL
ncbi:hypothetical protein IWW50_003737 [Coemansia erecta]|nr:hypothetical protein IWW50_003737 [Coemansia erecta]